MAGAFLGSATSEPEFDKITMSRGGSISPDNTTAIAAAGAATLNAMAGVVTTAALTTAAAADYTLTLSNGLVKAGDIVLPTVQSGTNTTIGLAAHETTVSDGQVVFKVRNAHASAALNGTIKIGFIVFSA